MNAYSTFGPQRASSNSVHVSSQTVKAPSTDSTRPASAPASSSTFSAAFASASQPASSQKSSPTGKQGSDKKAAREKTATGDTATASTVPVNPWLSQIAAPAALGAPTVATAPDSGGKGDTGSNSDVAAPVAAAGVKSFSEMGVSADKPGAPATSDQANASSELTSAGGDAASASTVPQGKGDPATANVDSLTTAQVMSSAASDGQVNGATPSDAKDSATPVAPDATIQAMVAAQPAPVPQAPAAQPWSVSTDKAPATVDAVGASSLKVQASTVSASDGLAKQAIGTSKERGGQPDVRGKRKADDSDASTSDVKADGSFAARMPLQVQQADPQAGTSSHHGADAQAMQQAMQTATSTGTGNTPATFSAADSNAASVPVPAGTPSAHTATDVQAMPAVNSAHLMQSIGQSEMKLGMHSAEFGSISINTSVTHDALSAQISTSHAALGQALTVHLPSIQERLGTTYGLQARVEVRDSSGSGSGDTTQQSKDGRQNQGSGSASRSSTSTYGTAGISGATVRSTSLSLGSSRLDIRI